MTSEAISEHQICKTFIGGHALVAAWLRTQSVPFAYARSHVFSQTNSILLLLGLYLEGTPSVGHMTGELKRRPLSIEDHLSSHSSMWLHHKTSHGSSRPPHNRDNPLSM